MASTGQVIVEDTTYFRGPFNMTGKLPENSILSILKEALPNAYNFFSPKSKVERNLSIESSFFHVQEMGRERKFMNNSELKDTLLWVSGLTADIPFIFNTEDPNEAYATVGDGVSFYKTSIGNMKYAIVSYWYEGDPHSWLVVKETDKEALFKYFKDQNNKNEVILTIGKPPVLKEGLLEEVMKNSIEFLAKHAEFARFGARLSRGIILQGIPGNGKTMLCKWIIATCEHKDLLSRTITSTDIEEAYKRNSLGGLVNCANIVLFDDVDISFLSRRKNGSISDSRLACSLLSAMDGTDEMDSGVVRIFTTNEKVVDIDPAFLRPGRIDKVCTFDNPDFALRQRLVLEFWNKDIVESIDINKLCKESEGCSFAELDEIKTLLVQEFLISDRWNLDKALIDFKNRKDASKILGKLSVKPKAKAKKK